MKTNWRILFLVGAGVTGATLLSGRQSADDSGIPGVGQLGGPRRTLTAEEGEVWLAGRALFDKNFHKSDGLGTPDLNADSCRACHQFPVLGGGGGLDLNVFRYAFDNTGAGPFMDLPGGQVASKLRASFFDADPATRSLDTDRDEHDPIADVFEQRQTPALFGAGLIDSIPDAEILQNEDPDDLLFGDGIRGVARVLNVNGVDEVGRFGWKAQIPRLEDFIRDAMAGECGITTEADGRGFGLVADGDAVADPELPQARIDDMLFFLAELAPPPRKDPEDPQVLHGETLFETVGCAKCHIPVLMGDLGPVPLYSNLLLHNVRGVSARGMAEPGAPAGFFRTPPLWGISGTAPYMHDGRSETLEDAIEEHQNEAANVRAAYRALSDTDQEALIAFLKDL